MPLKHQCCCISATRVFILTRGAPSARRIASTPIDVDKNDSNPQPNDIDLAIEISRNINEHRNRNINGPTYRYRCRSRFGHTCRYGYFQHTCITPTTLPEALSFTSALESTTFGCKTPSLIPSLRAQEVTWFDVCAFIVIPIKEVYLRYLIL